MKGYRKPFIFGGRVSKEVQARMTFKGRVFVLWVVNYLCMTGSSYALH